MTKQIVLIATLMIIMGALPVLAADCVEVDIELPSVVIPGPGTIADGYFELTNCGDEAGEISLSLDIEIIFGQGEFIDTVVFNTGVIPIAVGAGETISREFQFPVANVPGAINLSLCVTASIGDATASDCATMVVEGEAAASGDKQGFDFKMASSEDCVEVSLELPDLIVAPGPPESGYFELTNCGDEAAEVLLGVEASISLGDLFDTTVTFDDFPVTMGAGETIAHEFQFPMVPIPGTFTFCITATSNTAVAYSCQTVVVEVTGSPEHKKPDIKFGAQNFPNPFNPSTEIFFELPQASHVSLVVYNAIGQKVRTLLNGQAQAGPNSVEWNGQNDNGHDLSSGIYFYRLTTDNQTESRKMLLVK